MSGARVKSPPEISSGSSTCRRVSSNVSSSTVRGRSNLAANVLRSSSSGRARTSCSSTAISRSPKPGPRSLTMRAMSLRSRVWRFAIVASSNVSGVRVYNARGAVFRWRLPVRPQGVCFGVDGGEVFAGPAHAGVLGADEACVRGYGLSHPLDGAAELGLELPPDDLAEALAQGVGLLAELLAGLAATVREDEQPVTSENRSGDDPRHIQESGRGDGDYDGPDAHRPDLESRGLGDGALQRERQLLRLALAVVALHHVLGVLADRAQKLAAVVVEGVADLPDQALVVVRLTAPVHVIHDRAPLLQVPVYHPVHELIHPLIHELLGVSDDLPLEALAHPLLAEQLEDVTEADVLLQPGVAPLVHPHDDVLDLGHPRLEISIHVLPVKLELGLHVLRRPEILVEERQALVHRAAVTPIELFHHPERALHLQPDPALFVEQVGDVIFQLRKAARPHQGVAFHGVRGGFGFSGQEGGDEEDRGRQAERGAYSAVNEGADLFSFLLVCQEVGLVDDEQDLLPPVADELEVAAFALGQRTLGRGDEQHQIAPRHETPGELLVVADDRVRPRRIYDGDLTQKLVGIALFEDTVSAAPLHGLLGVAQYRDAVGGGCYALFGDIRAEQGIYER